MKNGDLIHPGADVELLSRWHDGELSAGEQAHFEVHRARCAPCRRAAEQYSATLAFYRGSRTGRAPRDLSARILRRIQPSGTRRPPVGIVHGIDLRWAAAAVLAIIAGVFGRAGLERREPLLAPIQLVTPTSEIVSADAAMPPAPEPSGAAVPVVAPAPPSRRSRSVRLPEARPVYPAPGALAASPLPAVRVAAAPARVAVAHPSPVRRSAERFGGEGAGGELSALSEPPRSVPPLEIRITAADAGGWPPAVINADAIRLPAEQRGLRYLIMVDPQGAVRAVETILPATTRRDRVLGVVAPADVWKIRFEGNGRPRRLLLKVD